MDKKSLIILVSVAAAAMLLGFGAVWVLSGNADSQDAPAPRERATRSSLQDTGTIDLFGLVLPCRQKSDGETAIVRADLQIVVPLKYRIKVENQTSKIRDIIATILRNSDADEINRDDLAGFKRQLIGEVRRQLDTEISEVLVLRFSYDTVSMHVNR